MASQVWLWEDRDEALAAARGRWTSSCHRRPTIVAGGRHHMEMKEPKKERKVQNIRGWDRQRARPKVPKN